MPSGGTRSRNGSCCGGTARCTASITLSYCCGPVIASTCGNLSAIVCGSAPMQPGAMTLPFSFRAGPIAVGDDSAVFCERGTERRERFLLGAVEKAAGIDDDEVGAGVLPRQLVTFGA